MKRIIKFRAISMCKGEHWLYGDLIHYNRNPRTEKWTIRDPNTGLETDIDETTIGQFTGLHDENGKEIYEGDIIKHTKGLVRKDVTSDWEEDNTIMEVCYRDAGYNIDVFSHSNTIEIIGNKHDNPELLIKH